CGACRELGEGGRTRVIGGGVFIHGECRVTAADQHHGVAHLTDGRGEARVRAERRERCHRGHYLRGGRGRGGDARVGGVKDLAGSRVGDLDAHAATGRGRRERRAEHGREAAGGGRRG